MDVAGAKGAARLITELIVEETMSGDEMIACLKRQKIGLEKQAPTLVFPHYGARQNEPPFRNQTRRKMTKLRNMVGIAFVTMSLLTGLAVTSAPAQQVTIFEQPCEYLLGYGYMCD